MTDCVDYLPVFSCCVNISMLINFRVESKTPFIKLTIFMSYFSASPRSKSNNGFNGHRRASLLIPLAYTHSFELNRCYIQSCAD